MSRLRTLKNPTAQKQVPRWKIILKLLSTLFIVCILGISWLTYTHFFQKKYNQLKEFIFLKTINYGLVIQDIFIGGRHKTTLNEVLKALQVKPGASMLQVDLEEAYEALSRLPWIKSVILERRWPDTLYITLKERKPLALWQFNQKVKLIDEEGLEIPNQNINDYQSFPIVIGEGAPDATVELLEVLSKVPFIKNKTTAATRVGTRRWNLRLNNGLTLMLPEENISRVLMNLERVEKEHKVFEKAKISIDLRIARKMTLR